MEDIYKRDRIYLFNDKDIAKSFNTYAYYPSIGIPFEPFNIEESKELDKRLIKGRLSLFNYTQTIEDDNRIRMSINAPLFDIPDKKEELRKEGDCSIKALVTASNLGTLGRATYDYSDFMYCKHLGKVSNNYLVTLRRFVNPVGDHINHSYGKFGKDSKTALHEGDNTYFDQKNAPDIGRMVTWMGVSGNELSNILSYSVRTPWNSKKAEWQSNKNASQTAGNSFLGNFLNSFDKGVQDDQKSGKQGGGKGSLLGLADHLPIGGDSSSATYDPKEFGAWNDKNKPFGNAFQIVETAVCGSYGDEVNGLEFTHDISLVFEYELRSYDGINPKSAFLDLIGNILNVCYAEGNFWGGGYRNVGANASNIYTNLPLFKDAQNGKINDFGSFIDSLGASISSIFSGLTGRAGFSVKGLTNFLSAGFGGLTAGLINKLGRPQKQMLNSLLNPAPTGLWHLTIGNPKHPIMSIGNLYIDSCKITHTGILGLDDFPTGLKVEIGLKHGKPRSTREIEFMYLNGDSRIYFPLSTRYAQMYGKAKTIKNTDMSNSTGNELNNENDEIKETDLESAKFNRDLKDFIESETLANKKYVMNTGLNLNDVDMMKYFMMKDPKIKSEATAQNKNNNSNNKVSNTNAAKKA